MPSPTLPLLVPAQVMAKVTDVMPVPLICTAPHAVPVGSPAMQSPPEAVAGVNR